MIKFKLLLLCVLSVLLFTNFLSSQTSLDDFDFNELDSFQIDQDTTYLDVYNLTLSNLKSSSSEKHFILRQVINLRDARLVPHIITLIDTTENIDLKLMSINALAIYSDTTHFVLPVPKDAYTFAIEHYAKPKLIELLSDSLSVIVSESAHALFALTDSTLAFPAIRNLLSLGYYDALLGFDKINVNAIYNDENITGTKMDLRAKKFIENYLNHNEDSIRARAAWYLIQIGDSTKSVPIAKEILNNSSNNDARIFAEKIIYNY